MNSSISPISIKDLVYSSSSWNKDHPNNVRISSIRTSSPDSEKSDKTWQPNNKASSSLLIRKSPSYHKAVSDSSNTIIRRIRQIGPDGSYYDCDSCALPKGGWQKYWKDITLLSCLETKEKEETTDSSISSSSTESCEWLGDTLICCENCPITLHFACVCAPMTKLKSDIWLCASCEQHSPLAFSRMTYPLWNRKQNVTWKHTMQTSPTNIQYQIASWKWFQVYSKCPDSLTFVFSQLSQLVGYRNTTEFTPQWIVFSAFDGIAAARLALQRLGITHVRYYASEIDSHALQVSHTRFPDIIPLGDIRQISCRDIPEGVDFMIGGSPCQSLSRLGHQQGIQSGPSSLFFEYVRLFKEWKPRYFLLENVASMNAHDKEIITEALGGVEPILVDAARFSAGIRYRYYWTNIPNAKERILNLEEKPKCYLQDILLDHARAQYPKAYTITTNNYAPRAFDNRFNTVWYNDQEKRGLHIIEAERILGFPDNYTECVECSTESQKFRTRWKLLGNSFCVPVIEAFCSFLLESIVTNISCNCC